MENVLVEVEKYVSSLLRNELPHTFVYHNLGHTLRVIKSLKELIESEKTEGKDAENLLIAGWFHDVGYIKGCENHEENSANIASEFLENQNLENKRINNIKNLILATKMGYEPDNLLEKIICDADNSHFGKKSYAEISGLLREEWEQQDTKSFSDSKWTQENITFFIKYHRFYTDYALNNWQRTKDKNLSSLYKTLKKQKKDDKKNKAKTSRISFKEE